MIQTFRNPSSGIRVSSTDTTSDYLFNKLSEGSGIILSIENESCFNYSPFPFFQITNDTFPFHGFH